MTEIKVPGLGESVTKATVAKWLKSEGDFVEANEVLAELETDKVTVEIYAPQSGVLSRIMAKKGASIKVGSVLCELATDARKAKSPKKKGERKTVAAPKPQKLKKSAVKLPAKDRPRGRSGKGESVPGKQPAVPLSPVVPASPPPSSQKALREERVRMSSIRLLTARRLKEAQNNAAILTTFNEIDMSAVTALRNDYRENFQSRHGVRLGFMSFFVKASVLALKEFPSLNAEVDGEDIIYKDYYNIGVAVSTPQGLVVPVVSDAEKKSMAEIEKEIAGMSEKARAGQTSIRDLEGGTFTITNGGVFGSLLSTPILNPPQSAILGMHKVQQRPVVLPDGSIAARPMMYAALSYDHRIIDGHEAVSFLMRVKEAIEEPGRLLLDV